MIDKVFIEKWAPLYKYSDKTYCKLLERVQEDIKEENTISREIFEDIIKWKATRNYNNVSWIKFEIYKEAIDDVLKLQGYKKLCRLVGLPGILLPNASTIVHFMYPNKFSIVDIRTVRALLFETYENDGKVVHYLDTRFKIDYYRYNLWGYHCFKNTIEEISRLTEKSLREIDKALFTYDNIKNLKVYFSNGLLKE